MGYYNGNSKLILLCGIKKMAEKKKKVLFATVASLRVRFFDIRHPYIERVRGMDAC